MYSPTIERIFKKKGIKIGDRVVIERNGKKYEGLLMPKTKYEDENIIVIKLDNGYNVGFKANEIEFYKSQEKEPKNVEEEAKYELGRTKKSLLEVKFDPSKPKISLISTGGTIISRVDYRTGGVYAVENPKELLHNIPEIAGLANMEMSSPINKMSEDMGPDDWILLARHVAKELNTGKKGVIVTHGTDTLHYTSAALSFFLKNLGKPIILVGAQRSGDRGSSDAGMNLICATHIALSNFAEVGICMHGSVNDSFCYFIRGTKARKMHSTRRDAFQSINEPPLAKVFADGKIEILNSNYKRRDENKKVEVDAKIEKNVAILKVYPGADPKVIDFYVRRGIKGFVIEGTGMGHVPTELSKKPWTLAIKKYSDHIPFVITTQTIYGRVNPYVYTNLRKLFIEAKAIPGEDMLTEVAYVKLMWVLGKTKSMEKIREMMLTNYAGEITMRSSFDALTEKYPG